MELDIRVKHVVRSPIRGPHIHTVYNYGVIFDILMGLFKLIELFCQFNLCLIRLCFFMCGNLTLCNFNYVNSGDSYTVVYKMWRFTLDANCSIPGHCQRG